MARYTLFGLAWCFAAPAFAQAPPELHASAPSEVSVTIYRDDLALIIEKRSVDLPGGPARIVFDGVLDRAIPQSATLRGLTREKERNFDFDGLSPQSLLRRSIGERVVVARVNPGSGAKTEEAAIVRAAGDGVTLDFGGRYEALGCSGLPEKLIFAKLPEGLRAKPALSTTIVDAPAGRREITLSYLAKGLDWRANYIVTLNGAGDRADIHGWLTLSNAGEQGFGDAELGVVAGDLSRVWTPETRAAYGAYAARACWPMGTTSDFPEPPPPPPPPMMMAAPVGGMMRMAKEADGALQDIVVTAAKREELGDYQLYKIGWRTSVAPKQTKQVTFLDKNDVKVARVLRYVAGPPRDGDRTESTEILLRTKNDEANGLGEPLPQGDARVFAPAKTHGTLYAGEGGVRDTAVDLDWELRIGVSQAVTVAPQTVSYSEGRDGYVTATMRYEMANALASPQKVELVQVPPGASLRIRDASARHFMKKGAPTWTLIVPARGTSVLNYTMRYKP